MLIGVLALQGDFESHEKALESIGHEAVEIRRPEDAGFANPAAPRESKLKSMADPEVAMRRVPDGIVLPGGESSTIDLLGRRYGFQYLIPAFAASGKVIFGTCAGAIWLGKGVHHKVKPLELIDVTLERNAYGRQVDSFSTPVEIEGLDSPYQAVFIRAPRITAIGAEVQVLAEYEGDPILVRKGNIILSTFHPEQTMDYRVQKLVFG